MGKSTSGKVTVTETSFPLADVDVFVVGREWEPLTTSNAMGEFKLKDICSAGLTLKFLKSGYFSELEQYEALGSGSVLAVSMTEMSKLMTVIL